MRSLHSATAAAVARSAAAAPVSTLKFSTSSSASHPAQGFFVAAPRFPLKAEVAEAVSGPCLPPPLIVRAPVTELDEDYDDL